MSDFDWLPGVLAEIAEAAGVEAALRISQAHGGHRVYIPAQAADGHWLVRLVGRANADAISKQLIGLRGTMILIPMGGVQFARQRFYASRAAGSSVHHAARLAGVHERTGFRWEKIRGSWRGLQIEHKPSPQISIFDVLENPALDKSQTPLHSAPASRKAAR